MRLGCAQDWTVSSQYPLAGRSSFMFKAVLNCSLKYWLLTHFVLSVLVLCREIPLSPAAGQKSGVCDKMYVFARLQALP